ncbi:hypothetical protein CLOM_g12926 [Closterium sp. NIES-68]|nr:hypothetical protein CLOM_g12926 [Closterium sp. NIES-68]
MGGLEAALTLVGAVADEILTRGEAAGAVGTTATPASSTAPPATSTTRSSRRIGKGRATIGKAFGSGEEAAREGEGVGAGVKVDVEEGAVER